MFVTSVVVVLTYAFVTTSLKTKPRNKCTLNIEKQKQNMIFTIPVLAWYKWKIHCPYDWRDLSQFKPSFQSLSSEGSFALISNSYVQVSITHVIPCSLFLFHCVRKYMCALYLYSYLYQFPIPQNIEIWHSFSVVLDESNTQFVLRTGSNIWKMSNLLHVIYNSKRLNDQ
jgi:hypothetical protein